MHGMAYVAIKTQWLAPTKYKGGRIEATAMDCFTVCPLYGTLPSITRASETQSQEMHHAVAMELLQKVCNSPNDVKLGVGAGHITFHDTYGLIRSSGYGFVIQQKVRV